MKNKRSHTNNTSKRIIALAEAVAMNAAPEYWVGIKQAGMHLFSMCVIARQFLNQS